MHKCFKNISKTLHQNINDYLNSNEFFIDGDILIGPDSQILSSSVPYKANIASLLTDLPEDFMLTKVSWLKMSGRIFKPGAVIIINMDLMHMPVFGVIIDVLVFEVDNYYIVYEELETECFSHHYHAYEVSHHQIPLFGISHPSDFTDNCLLSIYRKQSSMFIPL